MQPELVLNLRPGSDAKKVRDEWLANYKAFAEEFLDTEKLAKKLSKRVERAYELYTQRQTEDVMPGSRDETYYEEADRIMCKEDAKLDGNFPLGNERDARFANDIFTISDLVKIQLGYHNLVNCGTYTEYNYAVLSRNGFIAELNKSWIEAVRCYEGTMSAAAAEREADCRKKAMQEGERYYNEGMELVKQCSWAEAWYPLHHACCLEHVEAMAQMGMMSIFGLGCLKNTDEGLEKLRWAANRGSANAAFALCELSDSGVGAVTAAEAKQMCEKAAELGMEEAKIRLEDGFDLRPAREILQEQIDNGDIDSMWRMAQQCEWENDQEAEAEWIIKAAEAGQTDALLYMAKIFADPQNAAYDQKTADVYLKKAADNGCTEALILLGNGELKDTYRMFFDKESREAKAKKSVLSQHKKQMEWYKLAAQNGHVESMCHLATAYHYGYPVMKDDAQAFLWASRAADEDDADALYKVGYFYEFGCGVEADMDSAILFYTRAAEKGVLEAIQRLYVIYRDGADGIAPDKSKAEQYLLLSGDGRD